jgi:hypothetical protein
LSLLDAFHPQGFDPGLGQGLFQVLGKSRNVPPGSGGANNKIIGKRTEFLNLQNYRVQTLMLDQGPDGQFYQNFREDRD